MRSILMLLLFSSSLCLAQERAYRNFNTQIVREITRKQYTEYTQKLESIEKSVSDYKSRGDNNQVYRIPIIFHILESGSGKFPDEEQVRYQLDVLNKAFGSYDPKAASYTNEAVEKFAPMGTSPDILFYIPDTFGGVKGINTVKTDKNNFGLSNEIQNPKSGGIAAVDSKKVINIWIGELGTYNAGYAHLPGAPEELDGIVIDPDFFGNEKGTAKTPYTQGKTLVHLMGTYLGLYELWNESDPCVDDMVADTPIHSGPNQEIGDGKDRRLITLCHGYILAMYMNFMDNSDDAALTLFTRGQKDRMRAMLTEGGPRSGLVTK